MAEHANSYALSMTSAQVAGMPWVFTQNHPLDTSSFVSEAKRRGFDLDVQLLRELYRHGLLAPFVYLSDRRVGPVPSPIEHEPRSGGALQMQLRHARDRGRLYDLNGAPFRPRLHFERRDADPRRWWNGFIYSRYQILVLPQIDSILARRRHYLRDRNVITRLPKPDQFDLSQTARPRMIATVLTALEARYLPKLDPEWIQLVNTDEVEWGRYRDQFDPVKMSQILGYSAQQAREDAEWLLFLAHRINPVGRAWLRLMRRAPRAKWKDLKDAALLTMDYREAAEILLCFYEDLVGRGEAEALPVIPPIAWHPLHERLSYRPETLDQDLMGLGISPHPRVVLAVEGEAEEVHAPLVGRALGYSEAPELIRLLKLGGVDRDLEKIAALAAAPLVGGKIDGHAGWWVIKPPTRLQVAVDPERSFETPEKVERVRQNILREIKAVLSAQGVDTANESELDELVKIRTWDQSCYEFAHFTDDELADGIMAIHTTIDGWSRDELVQKLGVERQRRKDIKEVWSRWSYKPSKTRLAHALWPILEGKIQRCRVETDAPVPQIAEVIADAYYTAQRWRYLSFALGEGGDTPSTSRNE